MAPVRIAYIPSSHLDLFWLGNYKTCLARGAELIKQYLDRCVVAPDETFLLESVVFAEYLLDRFPQYRDILVSLVREGRVEVGAAYVDRWENLILGESHIRNILFGKRWCRAELGIENALVTHPDLPGLVPQIAQIYAQAGIRYYVTSRKVYAHGAVWRYRSPDGSSLLMLNWPRHYVYVPLDLADIPAELRESLWVQPLDLQATGAGFPLGTIALSGSAGDLADRETFRERNGALLEECVAANRRRYPELEFSYTTPSQVLAAYEQVADLPEHSGEVPSVWGVAADEEVTFFQRDRLGEGLLLTAETLAAVSEHLGLDWRPATVAQWQGAFFEGAFFGRTDPIRCGSEFDALWRMHVITQDHNGGGQEGALSTFQKRVMQERCNTYCREIIDHALAQIDGGSAVAGGRVLAFNPHGQSWSGAVAVTLPAAQWHDGLRLLDEAGRELPAQVEGRSDDAVDLLVEVPEVPSIGYRTFAVGRPMVPSTATPRIRVSSDGDEIRLRSDEIEVAVDRRTGSLTGLTDLRRDQHWGGDAVGRLRAWHEIGNDVTLRMDTATEPDDAVLLGIDEPVVGPLFTRLRVRRELHHALVEETVTLWEHTARVEVEVRLFWWGAHDLQIRLGLPSVSTSPAIAYGSPFFGSAWTDVVSVAAPRNRDEILPEDYASYREVQGWLHLAGSNGGLTICTSHPGFHFDAVHGLSAVLLRTASSCGDNRLCWENAGEQVFHFSLQPGERSWQAAQAPRLGAFYARPPVTRFVAAAGPAHLPSAQSFLQVGGSGVLLSSLAPAVRDGAVVARVYDATGNGSHVTLAGPLARQQVEAVNLLEEDGKPLTGGPEHWQFDLSPWRLQTFVLGGAGEERS